MPVGAPGTTNVTQLVRGAPWEFWQNVDYDQKDDLVALYSLRCRNTSTVACRIKVNLGRGANTQEYAAIVQPGEDRTYPNPNNPAETQYFPVNLKSVDYGIAIEQV